MSNVKKLTIHDDDRLIFIMFPENPQFRQWENKDHLGSMTSAVYRQNTSEVQTLVSQNKYDLLVCWCDQADQLAFYVHTYDQNYLDSPGYQYLKSRFPNITCRSKKHVVLDDEMDVVSFRLMFGDRIKNVQS